MTLDTFNYSKIQLKSGQKTLARIWMNDGMCYYSHQIQKRTVIKFDKENISFQYIFPHVNLTRTVILYYKDIRKICFN